jgi:dienelactone hydrolase
MCYGGGRALEAASGWYHGGAESYFNDAFSKRPPPPHVDPVACIAWYPTRYDAKKLFGKDNEGFRACEDGSDRNVAVMAVFAERDSLPGATVEDATLLKACLDEDPRVKDAMVKVFPNQDHGFAHNLVPRKRDETSDDVSGDEMKFIVEDGYGGTANLLDHEYSSSDAEVACLLSTAWMETYTRVFLPTIGAPVRFDEDESWSTVQMSEYSAAEKRDVRKELEEAIANYEELEIDMRRMSQSTSEFLDEIPADFKEIEEGREKVIKMIREKYGLTEEDDEEMLEEKLNQAIEDGLLDRVMVDAYLYGDAYW